MSDRYQREIEEILRQAGEAEPPAKAKPAFRRPPRPSLRRLAWSHLKQSLGGKAWSISPGRAMLAAVLLLLAALVLNATMPGFTGPVALAGLILFIVAYGMFFIRPRKPPEKRWRGQVIDIDEESDSSRWDRLRGR